MVGHFNTVMKTTLTTYMDLIIFIDWNGEGMVIIRANSLDHAEEITSTDPMHQSGARNFTVDHGYLTKGIFKFR